MIGNITKGPGFRGCIKYVSEKEGAELIGGTFAGNCVDEMCAEFDEIHAIKPTAVEPVFHVSLSLADGEHLSSDQWNEVAARYLEEMGFGNSQWAAYRHTDEDKDHIHIVASRIDMDGKLVNVYKDYDRSQVVERGIERSYGLRIIESSKQKTGDKQISSGAQRLEQRTGNSSEKRTILQVANAEAKTAKTLDEYRSSLQNQGVETKVTFDRNGQPKDLLYSSGDFKIRGVRLSNSLSLKGFERGGMVVDRDQLKQERPPESKAWERFGAAKERETQQRETASNAFASVRQTREEIKGIKAQMSDLRAERRAEVKRINDAFKDASKAALEKSRDSYSSPKLGKKIKRTDFTKEAMKIEGVRAGFDAAKAEAFEKRVAPYDAKLRELGHNLNAANERLQRGLDRADGAKSDVDASRLEMAKAKLEATGGSDGGHQKKVNELEEKAAGSATERAEMMHGKMRVDAANQFLQNLDKQMKGLEESSKRDLASIQNRIGENQNLLAGLRDEMGRKLNATRESNFTNTMKGKAVLGKERHQIAKKYVAEIRTIQSEQKQLRRDAASTRINASGDRLLLMREKYYAELRATSERYAANGKTGSKEHQDALSRVDARYSKAFEREAASIDRTFKARQDQFKQTGNVTWFSDKGKARTERIKGAFVATKEAIKGIVTGKSWKETIKATQEKWAERSINARFASDRTRGEAVRDLWKLDLSRAQQERAAAIADLGKKVAGNHPMEEVEPSAKDAKEALIMVPEVKAAKLPEMNKEMAEVLRPLVAEAVKESKTFKEFKARLAERGIGVEVNRRGEHVSGLVYAKDGAKAKASSIGHGLKQLEEKGVDCGSIRAGLRTGGQPERGYDPEAGRGEIGGCPGAGVGREGEGYRAETRGPESRGTRNGAEAAKLGTDLGASRVEPSEAPRDHQRPGESEGRIANGREELGGGLEGREGGGTGRDAASLENRPRPDADRTSATSTGRPAEPGRGAEPQRTADAGRAMDQPGSQPSRDAGRAPVVPPVQEVSPARAAAEQRCNTFIAAQKEQVNSLENEKARLQGRVDQAKDQVGRELKPGEARVSLQERAELRDGLAKLEARIYQERSRMQEAAVLKSEGRAEQWSQGLDMEQKAQAIREGASQLPLAERSIKLAESHQLDSAAYTIKHGPDPLHGKAKDLGAAQWKAGRLMEGVNRLEKEGHIGKQDAAHIKDGFAGGWNRKQLVEAVKTLEGAGVHRDRPPEKAGQDMLKAACDAVQKCCGKGFDIGKGLEKGPSLSLDR